MTELTRIQGLKDEIEDYYNYWLMERYPEEIHCSDDLIELVESAKYQKEFIEHLVALAEL